MIILILLLVLSGAFALFIMMIKGYEDEELKGYFLKGMLIYGLIKAIRMPKREMELTDYITFSIARRKDKAKIAEYEKLGYEVVSMNSLMTGVTMRKVKRNEDDNDGTA